MSSSTEKSNVEQPASPKKDGEDSKDGSKDSSKDEAETQASTLSGEIEREGERERERENNFHKSLMFSIAPPAPILQF
jgi:hypothetical protein